MKVQNTQTDYHYRNGIQQSQRMNVNRSLDGSQRSQRSERAQETDRSRETFGLDPNGGEINEEEFQNALVNYMLEDMNPAAAAAYEQAYQKAVSQGMQPEDAVKAALKSLVEGGLLSQGEAEKINGITFRAAQLDDNLNALYDGKGGAGDSTIATASVEEAIAKAEEVFSAVESGEMQVSSRSLDAPSNVAPSSQVSAGGSGSGEFLWKPESESDGNLVVLLPSQYTGQIVSAGIYSDPSGENLIDEGRFAGDDHNGGRAHFRFSKNGGSYPDGSYVVAQLTNGQTVSFKIGETSGRVTQ
jgi:hypothetical protein